MTTPSSVPAQGEAMEVLQLCLDALQRALKHHSTTSLPLAIENYGSREATGAEGRKVWRGLVPQAIDRARALVAAPPCADRMAEPCDCGAGTRADCVANTCAKVRAAAQGGQQPAGWAHNEDPDRVISAAQKRQAEKDGGASASSVRAYTVALYAAPAPAAPLTEAATLRDALERVIATTRSHVDGRDLLAELHPRRMLDIKRRVDGRETWFEGDWLSNLWEAVKGAERVLAGRPFDLPRPSGPAIGSSMDDSSCEAGITLAGTAQKGGEDGR